MAIKVGGVTVISDNRVIQNASFSNTIIAAVDSNDALRITQTGTGNALVVEDSSNPDNSPFIINQYGRVGIQSQPRADSFLTIEANATGGSTAYGIVATATLQPDITVEYRNIPSYITTSASTTVGQVRHFTAAQGTLGAGSTIADQAGFAATSGLTGATYNMGFRSGIPDVTAGAITDAVITKISCSGTTATITTSIAHNYTTGQTVTINATANATSLVSGALVTILTVGTTDFTLIGASANTIGTSFVATGAGAGTGTVTLQCSGSGKTVASPSGTTFTIVAPTASFTAITLLTGTVSVSTRYNFYADGTAPNFFAGRLGIGTTAGTNTALIIGSTPSSDAATTYGVRNISIVPGTTTSEYQSYQSSLNTAAVPFTLNTYTHYSTDLGTIGAGSTITNQTGYRVSANLISATNNYGLKIENIGGANATTGKSNYGVFSNVATSTGGGNAYNIYSAGTAPNYFGGDVAGNSSTPSKLSGFKTGFLPELLQTITVSANAANIDVSTGTAFYLDLSTATGAVTITFTNVPAGTDLISTLTVITKQGATARAITWSPVPKWANNQTPPTPTVNTADAWSFFYYNSVWVGSLSVASFS